MVDVQGRQGHWAVNHDRGPVLADDRAAAPVQEGVVAVEVRADDDRGLDGLVARLGRDRPRLIRGGRHGETVGGGRVSDRATGLRGAADSRAGVSGDHE